MALSSPSFILIIIGIISPASPTAVPALLHNCCSLALGDESSTRMVNDDDDVDGGDDDDDFDGGDNDDGDDDTDT